ncbi:MAG: hypothetical protein ACO3X1_16420 [Burkholderiaceae bacterium]
MISWRLDHVCVDEIVDLILLLDGLEFLHGQRAGFAVEYSLDVLFAINPAEGEFFRAGDDASDVNLPFLGAVFNFC